MEIDANTFTLDQWYLITFTEEATIEMQTSAFTYEECDRKQVLLQHYFTDINPIYNGGVRFTFNESSIATFYLFPHEIESFELAEAPPPPGLPHEPMVLQIFYKGEVHEIEADLLKDWNFNQNASRHDITERILKSVTELEPEWEEV